MKNPIAFLFFSTLVALMSCMRMEQSSTESHLLFKVPNSVLWPHKEKIRQAFESIGLYKEEWDTSFIIPSSLVVRNGIFYIPDNIENTILCYNREGKQINIYQVPKIMSLDYFDIDNHGNFVSTDNKNRPLLWSPKTQKIIHHGSALTGIYMSTAHEFYYQHNELLKKLGAKKSISSPYKDLSYIVRDINISDDKVFFLCRSKGNQNKWVMNIKNLNDQLVKTFKLDVPDTLKDGRLVFCDSKKILVIFAENDNVSSVWIFNSNSGKAEKRIVLNYTIKYHSTNWNELGILDEYPTGDIFCYSSSDSILYALNTDEDNTYVYYYDLK